MWLYLVGLSQVSKDWRFTFISRAERIWIQGLGAVAGEIAYAIVPILAWCLFFAGLFIFRACATASSGHKAMGRASNRCWPASTVIVGRHEIRTDIKLVRGTLEIFLETVPRVAHFGVALINLSQKFFLSTSFAPLLVKLPG